MPEFGELQDEFIIVPEVIDIPNNILASVYYQDPKAILNTICEQLRRNNLGAILTLWKLFNQSIPPESIEAKREIAVEVDNIQEKIRQFNQYFRYPNKKQRVYRLCDDAREIPEWLDGFTVLKPRVLTHIMTNEIIRDYISEYTLKGKRELSVKKTGDLESTIKVYERIHLDFNQFLKFQHEVNRLIANSTQVFIRDGFYWKPSLKIIYYVYDCMGFIRRTHFTGY